MATIHIKATDTKEDIERKVADAFVRVERVLTNWWIDVSGEDGSADAEDAEPESVASG